MAGQNHHFNRYAPEKIPYAIERYVKETNRLWECSTGDSSRRPVVTDDSRKILFGQTAVTGR